MKHLGTVKSGEYVGEWFEIIAEAQDIEGSGAVPGSSQVHDYARAQGIAARRWGLVDPNVPYGQVWIQGVKIGSEKKA